MNINIEDWLDYTRAFVGAAAAISIPFIDELEGAGQFLGVIGGLYMLYLSIKHKKLQIKNEQNKRPL